MPNWFEISSVYSSVSTTVDLALIAMFSIVGDVANSFSIFVTAMAVIYVALMGYSVMSGMIKITAREMGSKFAKIVFILFILNLLTTSGGLLGLSLYNQVWEIPEGIGAFFADRLSPFINTSAGGGLLGSVLNFLGLGVDNAFDGLMDSYARQVTIIGSSVSAAPGGGETLGLIIWFALMAPMFLTTISIFIAKFVSAVLFIIAPLVFGFSLLGFTNNFLMSWLRSLAVTFLTAILVFIIGAASLSIVMVEMLQLIANDGGGSFLTVVSGGGVPPGSEWSIPAIAPSGILALFALMLVTQAPSIASSIVGVAATNSQQATSFIQIGALQAASRSAVTPATPVTPTP
ncbi:MAG: type IV secretion system protein [Litorimonas sp.]